MSRICPYKDIRDICPGYDVNIKHQSVRLLVTMFGLVGCDPPMDTCFPKGAGCLRLIVRKYIVYKYPWQRVFSNLLSTLVGEVASRKPEGEVPSCAVLCWRLEPRS